MLEDGDGCKRRLPGPTRPPSRSGHRATAESPATPEVSCGRAFRPDAFRTDAVVAAIGTKSVGPEGPPTTDLAAFARSGMALIAQAISSLLRGSATDFG
ncbi:DUF6053 domain-containing protein [Lysobacter sp. CA199]|uniref:DUF6053 domain-containing protein n=1 Tax=Lysobacter sp. CA199 TaxID=3455608 RepID=UPI003F8D067D